MFYFGSDAACRAAIDLRYQINVVKWKDKVAENGNTQLSKVVK